LFGGKPLNSNKTSSIPSLPGVSSVAAAAPLPVAATSTTDTSIPPPPAMEMDAMEFTGDDYVDADDIAVPAPTAPDLDQRGDVLGRYGAAARAASVVFSSHCFGEVKMPMTSSISPRGYASLPMTNVV